MRNGMVSSIDPRARVRTPEAGVPPALHFEVGFFVR
jgi:hypothetical protein